MPSLELIHSTIYRYRRPVLLGPHKLMLRPQEVRDIRLVSFDVTMNPQTELIWTHDVADNAIATANFKEKTDYLEIVSRSKIEMNTTRWPVFAISASACNFPFSYSDDEWIDLGALTAQHYPDPNGQLSEWVNSFIFSRPTDTLSLLKDISAGIAQRTTYQIRESEGTQTPLETLDKQEGSCRDFAVLFVAAARCLGLGARVVSGYLVNTDGLLSGSDGSGSTHAWAEVFLPGAGWVAFDPTNRSIGSGNLISVAVVREMSQAVPVSGQFIGDKDDLLEMSVAVRITET
ncbi:MULTISPECIES: transglutaminase family protein [Thalassospira]|uniref:Transglutaminase n=1 Tax=Thalassospira profundimaris TaxID=502049 RepID=A0A367VK41_9PROT|nr:MULTISPECIES: transglutaminase family protein [Thalassospira]KZB70790.1 transglutaminase [Thalassospira sp. MCCC 1A01148]MBR9899512.1 transglutaminase family protein [Rhodospirillales bacterium]RCK25577.1 transglutaminase [Thalassospira profundimaris]